MIEINFVKTSQDVHKYLSVYFCIIFIWKNFTLEKIMTFINLVLKMLENKIAILCMFQYYRKFY